MFLVYLTRCFKISTTTDIHFRRTSWILTTDYPHKLT